jgi:hypothetical protein
MNEGLFIWALAMTVGTQDGPALAERLRRALLSSPVRAASR